MSSAKEDEKLECITEQDRDVAQSALTEFQAQNYAACLNHLETLTNRKDDFKVMHNKHVVEFYRENKSNCSRLQKNLVELLNKFDLDIDKLEDVEYCVAYFNIGILYYQQRQYSNALKITEKIYKFIEPLDETLGRQVGLLLIELHICVRQVDSAISLITFFHKQISNQSASAQVAEKSTKANNSIKGMSVDEILTQLDKYKIQCNLLVHSLKSASNDIKILHEANGNDVDVLYLFANQLYLEGKFEEAMKTLGKVPMDALTYALHGESSNALFYNNIGVIHHAMGKHNLACHYYQQALHEETKVKSSRTYHELMMNLGIALLYADKPANAFDCLIIAIRKFHRNARLWLRLAECCIRAHKPTNAADFDIHRKQKELVVDVLSAGTSQKVILNTHLTNDKKYSGESQSYAVPVATLEFGSLCLKNAEFLLHAESASSEMSPAPTSSLLIAESTLLSHGNCIFAPSSIPLTEDKVALKNCILAAYAYTALCLGDYVVALSKAKELLTQPRLPGAYKLLANLYAAECLVLQDKTLEALEHLQPENIKDIELQLPIDASNDIVDDILVTNNPPMSWFPQTLQSALSVMHYNVAIIKTIRGQYEQAAILLNQVWQSQNAECKVPAQIVMLVLYIKIQLGHVDVAKNFIRQYSIQRRICG